MILANHGVISSSGGVLYDADALAFMTAASITDNTQKTAVNTLVTDLKAYNIWAKMKAIYPFVGGSATSHKFNLKDPRDLDAAYRLVFNGGWTHSSTGALPNGTTAYADTKLIPFSTLALNSTHISYYSRTDTLANTAKSEIGVTSDASYLPLLHLRIKGLEGGVSNRSVSQIWSYEPTQSINVGVSFDSTGLFVGSRSSNSSFKLTRNNTLVGQMTTGNNQTTMPNARVYLGALNDSNINTFYYTDRETAFASIGDGLSDTEASNFYIAVQAYQTTLNRQV
jgi:hypothetical protein